MRCERFADIVELLQLSTDREALRAFGMKYEEACKNPRKLLLLWYETQRKKYSLRWGETLGRALYRFSLALYASAFLFGFLAAMGLLYYNGKEPVNVIYFLFAAFVLPTVSLLLSLAATFKATKTHNPFLHIGLSYVIERLWFRRYAETLKPLLKKEKRLLDWAVLTRTHTAALAFASGMLTGLLVTVATRDIAFVWSTTLDIDPHTFTSWLQTFAAPWHVWWPQAVPDATLIEQSRYFRLGGRIDGKLIAHAQSLGAWWKFLAATILFYTMLPRLVAALATRYYISRLMWRSLLRLAREHLAAMCTPVIKTEVRQTQEVRTFDMQNACTTSEKQTDYDTLVVVGLNETQGALYKEREGIDAKRVLYVGGARSRAQDDETLQEVKGVTAVIVKGWEPPTFELLDTLRAIASKATRTFIIPVGLEEDGFAPDAHDLAVWEKMISTLKDDTLCLIG